MYNTYQEFIQNILDTRGRFACGEEYHERHHIIPKCMGGTNDKDNLIDLFAKEHYEAHKLLALENPDNKSLVLAWHMMSHARCNGRDYKLTSAEYNEIRQVTSKAISGKNNSQYGKPSPRRGTHLTDVQKQHLRELNLGERSPKYGIPLSDEVKAKISAANKDRIATEETRLKLRKSHLGKNMGADSGSARRVAQYDIYGNLIKVWDCMADAERSLNLCRGAVYNACQAKIGTATAGGYQFRYVYNDIPDKIPKYVNQAGKYQIKTIARCDEYWNIIDIWDGYTAAQDGTGINRSHISSCCHGKRQYAGGYKWKILD